MTAIFSDHTCLAKNRDWWALFPKNIYHLGHCYPWLTRPLCDGVTFDNAVHFDICSISLPFLGLLPHMCFIEFCRMVIANVHVTTKSLSILKSSKIHLRVFVIIGEALRLFTEVCVSYYLFSTWSSSWQLSWTPKLCLSKHLFGNGENDRKIRDGI